jgi:hypothetical protein
MPHDLSQSCLFNVEGKTQPPHFGPKKHFDYKIHDFGTFVLASFMPLQKALPYSLILPVFAFQDRHRGEGFEPSDAITRVKVAPDVGEHRGTKFRESIKGREPEHSQSILLASHGLAVICGVRHDRQGDARQASMSRCRAGLPVKHPELAFASNHGAPYRNRVDDGARWAVDESPRRQGGSFPARIGLGQAPSSNSWREIIGPPGSCNPTGLLARTERVLTLEGGA